MKAIDLFAGAGGFSTGAQMAGLQVHGPRFISSYYGNERGGRSLHLPADYLLPDNQRAAMHMLGNAVCPPVARDVLNAIKEAA